MTKGAEFSDLQPKNAIGALNLSFVSLTSSTPGLDSGVILQVTPNNAFRLGQQIFFWLGISNPLFEDVGGDNWYTSVRLKPWWARPNMEFRQAGGGGGQLGATGFLGIDTQVFGPGPQTGLDQNRNIWIPSPKRLDWTEWNVPPPPVAVARTSDSIFLDDVWKLDLRDANDAAYIAQFPAPQVPARWIGFLYPAMGYALGFTWEGVQFNQAFAEPGLALSLSWCSGTLGGTNYQESVG